MTLRKVSRRKAGGREVDRETAKKGETTQIYGQISWFWRLLYITALCFAVNLAAIVWQGFGSSPAIAATQPQMAQATIADLTGRSQIQGQATFSEAAQGLQIDAGISGAPPGLHGLHIHEVGSCEQAGNAAKGHFNPNQVKHGNLLTDGFSAAHAGDLGNILIAPDGSGALSVSVPGLTLTEGKYAIGDRAIILHANQDDFSQPVGNAGGRIGCGKIVTSSSS